MVVPEARRTVSDGSIAARKNGATDPVPAPAPPSGGGSGSNSNSGSNKAGPLLEYQLKTLIAPGSPGGEVAADHVIDLKFGTAGNGMWEINNIVYEPPTLPTLLNIINGGVSPANYSRAEHTFILQPDELIELRIHGAAHGITHPFHLHGHAFDVVQSASGGPPNYKNPPRRDVVAVSDGGVIIRFRGTHPLPLAPLPLSNPDLPSQLTTPGPGSCTGASARPCVPSPSLTTPHIPFRPTSHIDWHLEAGLAVVFAEAPREFCGDGPKSGIVTKQFMALCPTYNKLAPELQ
ncbi:Cupredoxin [Mycena leptocephala]|nr:Cupredoxin [Mycena leptocephala]